MGSEFHRLVMAALAAGLLVIPGCGAGDGKSPTGSSTQGPPAVTSAVQPTIVSASIDGASTLHLTFSEAITPAAGVDPAKFRLTVAYYTAPAGSGKYSGKYGYAGKYGGTYAPGKYSGKYTGTYAGKYTGKYTGKYSTAYYGSYGYAGAHHTVYSDLGDISTIRVDTTTATTADLQLGTSFNVADECQEIQALNTANSNAKAGLYLHYSEAGNPTIQDTQGNKLASIADYWATDPTVEQVRGDFAGKPIPVSITCQ
jgi:hypothetical protein